MHLITQGAVLPINLVCPHSSVWGHVVGSESLRDPGVPSHPAGPAPSPAPTWLLAMTPYTSYTAA